jgi:hypothetical protein
MIYICICINTKIINKNRNNFNFLKMNKVYDNLQIIELNSPKQILTNNNNNNNNINYFRLLKLLK